MHREPDGARRRAPIGFPDRLAWIWCQQYRRGAGGCPDPDAPDSVWRHDRQPSLASAVRGSHGATGNA